MHGSASAGCRLQEQPGTAGAGGGAGGGAGAGRRRCVWTALGLHGSRDASNRPVIVLETLFGDHCAARRGAQPWVVTSPGAPSTVG